MSVLIAIGHLVGALVGLGMFYASVALLGSWETNHYRKIAEEEMCLALGIPVGELENEEHKAKIIQFAAERFSSELLRNRLSDFCGWLQTLWGWLGLVPQIGLLLVVIWNTFAFDLSKSVYAWWAIAVAILFWIPSVLFSVICKFLTGRFPGQARQARKMLSKLIAQPPVASQPPIISRGST